MSILENCFIDTAPSECGGSSDNFVVISGDGAQGRVDLVRVILEEAVCKSLPALVVDTEGDLVDLFFPVLNGESCRGEENRDIGSGRVDHLIITPGESAGKSLDLFGLLSILTPELTDHHPLLVETTLQNWFSVFLGIVPDLAPSSHPHLTRLFSAVVMAHLQAGRDFDWDLLVEAARLEDASFRSLIGEEVSMDEIIKADAAHRLNSFIRSNIFSRFSTGIPLDVETLFWNHDMLRHTLIFVGHLTPQMRNLTVASILGALSFWASGRPEAERLMRFTAIHDAAEFMSSDNPFLSSMLKKLLTFPLRGLATLLSISRLSDSVIKAVTLRGLCLLGRGQEFQVSEFLQTGEELPEREVLAGGEFMDIRQGRINPAGLCRVKTPFKPFAAKCAIEEIRKYKEMRSTGELLYGSELGDVQPNLGVDLPVYSIASKPGAVYLPYFVADLTVTYRHDHGFIASSNLCYMVRADTGGEWFSGELSGMKRGVPDSSIFRMKAGVKAGERLHAMKRELPGVVKCQSPLTVLSNDLLSVTCKKGDSGEEFFQKVYEIAGRESLEKKSAILPDYRVRVERIQERVSRIEEEDLAAIRIRQSGSEDISRLKVYLNRVTGSPWIFIIPGEKRDPGISWGDALFLKIGIEDNEIQQVAEELTRQVVNIETSQMEKIESVEELNLLATEDDVVIRDLYIAWVAEDKVQSIRGNL